MEIKGNKIEVDLQEFMPMVLQNKQEAFKLLGEKMLNAIMEK